jgi:hypothetical protein
MWFTMRNQARESRVACIFLENKVEEGDERKHVVTPDENVR